MDGKLPEGGNVAMLDGHVDWREFADMKVKFGTPSTPTFYW
jgi:prepilin-type processing-associated H-X9-DG protein